MLRIGLARKRAVFLDFAFSPRAKSGRFCLFSKVAKMRNPRVARSNTHESVQRSARGSLAADPSRKGARGGRARATTRFPRLPARRGLPPNRNSTRGVFALFFLRFRGRAPARKKGKSTFSKIAFPSLLWRRAENGRSAHSAKNSLAQRVSRRVFSTFPLRMALALRFPATNFFSPEIPPRMKKRNHDTVLG